MLFKYSCGCIGTKPVDGVAWSFISCDRDSHDNKIWLFTTTRFEEKECQPLDAQEELELWSEISKLVNYGHQFQIIKNMMRD